MDNTKYFNDDYVSFSIKLNELDEAKKFLEKYSNVFDDSTQRRKVEITNTTFELAEFLIDNGIQSQAWCYKKIDECNNDWKNSYFLYKEFLKLIPVK